EIFSALPPLSSSFSPLLFQQHPPSLPQRPSVRPQPLLSSSLALHLHSASPLGDICSRLGPLHRRHSCPCPRPRPFPPSAVPPARAFLHLSISHSHQHRTLQTGGSHRQHH